ncbi:hypothetical protein [Rubellimicrobium rubrum]|uniref:hypothetical protein n=1 Tax=Rubellimicrobium rubrum TaxID=2585369 RepID=UPI003CCC8968
MILLFYPQVTPEILETGLPSYIAIVLFAFPLAFVAVLIWSRLQSQRSKVLAMLAVSMAVLGWFYLSLISQAGTPVAFLGAIDLFDAPSGVLVVFASVFFGNAATVFRIVRGLALDLKTRDYVAAAQTRSEGAWYIMLWGIFPDARGPLVVDVCQRIG